jgi:structural maintenance of chromosome 3 (chondroitin sulfate proteoglycan 6)
MFNNLAIQFVLSDEFSHLKPEEKKQLLHEGTGSIVVSGYVEIIFDNSDNRIPIEREEVSLRRVIGPKKDTYYLDKKLVTKSDVMNLLEGAGFSRSNPYYIVKQGKINQLAVAPDAHRLKLLREVAGTRVYDERKEESTTILKETEAKQLKISEMLSYIEERLSTLEEEKEELRAYQDLDKMRRSLEYTIHDKEMRNIREKLEKLEETRSGSNQGSKQLHDEISNAQSKIESLEREIRDANSRLSNVLVEKDQLQDDQQDLIKQRAQMEFSVKDLEQSVVEDESKKESYTNELELLKKDIDSKEDQLKVILPKFQYQKDQEERLSARLKACEQHRSELFAKQGRVQQFSSTQERDRWINSEITSLQQSVAHKEQQIHQFEQDIIHLQDKVKQQEHDLQEKTDNFEETKVALDKLNRDHARLKIQRDELANERQEVWRNQNMLENSKQITRDELTKFDRNQRATMGKAIGQGLDAVNRISQEKCLSGVYGPLIDNFTCESRMFTAVEVTAGNRLYNVIVDTDETASKILTYMNQMRLPGEVTFLPLNKLMPPRANYPDSKEALPLPEQLEYDPMFNAAIQTIFGKTLVCKDMEKASHFAKTANINCITLDGDQVSHKGALTGGYYDSRVSKLELQKSIKELKSNLEKQDADFYNFKQQLDDIDGKTNQTLGKIQHAETKNIQLKEILDRVKQEIRNINSEHQVDQHNLSLKVIIIDHAQ